MAKFPEIKTGTIFSAGVLNPYGEFFVGDTYLTNLVTSPDEKIGIGSVSFERDGVKHWHGAKKDSWFEHIAITAGTPEWLEQVSDADYDALH